MLTFEFRVRMPHGGEQKIVVRANNRRNAEARWNTNAGFQGDAGNRSRYSETMTDLTLSIHMDDTGTWQARGHYLGYDLAAVSTSLWDCLEQCKQRVWDAELVHDASSGLLAGALLDSDLASMDRAPAQRPVSPAEADVHGDRYAHQLDARPDARPSAHVLRQGRHAVMHSQQASVAFIQRHLRIGYALATAVLESLVVEKTVSGVLDDGSRRVLRSFPPASKQGSPCPRPQPGSQLRAVVRDRCRHCSDSIMAMAWRAASEALPLRSPALRMSLS